MRADSDDIFWRFFDGSLRMIKACVLALSAILLVACGSNGSSYQPPAPQPGVSLSYPSAAQVFVVGTAITPITPAITGTLTSFTVSPALPAGLSVDSNKGTLSGTPTVVAATGSYTIRATGPGGAATSASLSITVNDVPPSNIAYSASSFTFSATLEGEIPSPTAKGGAVVSWSINPMLPAGLEFSTTDASISGTPSAPSASTAYVVTAQNSGGQSTATVKIAVDGGPLLNLGHQRSLSIVRATASNVLSFDTFGTWILWNYAGRSIIAEGSSDCLLQTNSCALPLADMAGSTAVVATVQGLEVHSTSDGHTLAKLNVRSGAWWRVATDGSYIAAGSRVGLCVWSPSGQLLFSRAGDYSGSVGFAAPGQVLIGAGPAGASVVESIAVPGGTATTSAQFNGQFRSWFADGSRFIATADTTVLVYSNGGVQQGVIASALPADVGATVVGQGNWVWIDSNGTSTLYPATGTNPAPVATYDFTVLTELPNASSVVVAVTGASTISVLDLSGSAPVKTDYTLPSGLTPAAVVGPAAAVSASQWLFATTYGTLLDSASLAGTPRSFGVGEILSMAGGTNHFAMATASGTILYFNAATLAQEGTIAFPASKVLLSADGALLAAMGNGNGFGVFDIRIYSLPAGALLYTWPYNYTVTAGGEFPQDIALSSSGAVLGQSLVAGSNGSVAVSSPTGGATIFSNTFPIDSGTPALRISPDGTLLAWSLSGDSPATGTNLLQNGVLVTAFQGAPVGWLDNSRLVVNTFKNGYLAESEYSGCSIYGPTGSLTGGSCAIPFTVEFQPVTNDSIYVPQTNQIISVSTGNIDWISGNHLGETDLQRPEGVVVGPANAGAVAGSRVVFVSGTSLVAQPY
jgi:Putative Ig domain